MVRFLVKTKDGAAPQGKARVYFTCHPEDFDRSFENICADIFAARDCAVYYTENMTAPIDEQDKAIDLEQMSLFVIPVTSKLLTQPNRAMNEDFTYAKKKHIPVLPIMLETGIDEEYSKPENFGERQYLYPYGYDSTEISYSEKLKRYLSSVLVDDDTAERVREAFDAYIFLSYRKKDRRYANELMRLIHKNPAFADVAIWYDEFLTPGENFRENIARALCDSKLFALLVTPNLLEKNNYVMREEYPGAQKAGLEILPVEMVATDKSELQEKYPSLPDCVDPRDTKSLDDRLFESLKKIAATSNDNDPEHNFLIGLAYLEGIDVEVNRERGVALITSAAESGISEAMCQLCEMYHTGRGVELDYSKSLMWAKRLADHYVENFGEEHPDTLTSLCNLALHQRDAGDYGEAMQLSRRVYELRRKVLGETHIDTLESLNNLALAYLDLGEYETAMEIFEKTHDHFSCVLGKEHPTTLHAKANLATTYGTLKYYVLARALNKELYELRCKVFGEEHPDTLISLNNLADAHRGVCEYDTALELSKRACELGAKVLGEEHPWTLTFISNLALIYSKLEEYETCLQINKKVYESRSRVLGEEHPDMLTTLNNLACAYANVGEYEIALEFNKKAYKLSSRALGKDHPKTQELKNNFKIAKKSLIYKKGLIHYLKARLKRKSLK